MAKKINKTRYYKMSAEEQFQWRIANGVEAYVDLIHPDASPEARAKLIEAKRIVCE